MKNFNTLLTLSELKEHYGEPPAGICTLYNGKLDKTVVESKTGNPIVLPPYKAITSLNISFSPQQAGNGDPSPDNVRAISGWDSVTVTQSKDEAQVKQITLTLPETIYGGTVDAVTGVGSKEWACYEITGEESWLVGSDNLSNVYRYYFRPKPGQLVGTAIEGYCNVYKTLPTIYTNEIGAVFGNGNSAIYLFLPKQDFPDVESVKSYLASQYAAGTPVQVAYKLATPKPFKVNPISIPSLGGINAIYSDADNLSCDFIISSFWSDAD